MGIESFKGLQPSAWGVVLNNINDLEIDRNHGILFEDESGIKIQLYIPGTNKKIELTLSDLLKISNSINADSNLLSREISEVTKGLDHVSQLVKRKIFGKKLTTAISKENIYFFEETSRLSSEIQKRNAKQGVTKKKASSKKKLTPRKISADEILKVVSRVTELQQVQIAEIQLLIDEDPLILFKSTSNGSRLIFEIYEKCKDKQDMLLMFKSIILNFEEIHKENKKIIIALLYYKSSEIGSPSIFELLMKSKDNNKIFDGVLKFIFPDDLNQNSELREQMYEFAYSMERYDYIFLKNEEIPEDLIKRVDEFLKKSRSIFNLSAEQQGLFQQARINSSNTLDDRNSAGIERWKAADLYVQKQASLDQIQISEEIVEFKKVSFAFIQKIHLKLCRGEEGIEKPGHLRKGIVRAGGAKTRLYCPPRFLEANVEVFMAWYNEGLRKCEQGEDNPVILAAQAYQRLVSLHPFENGNGRVTRMLMCYTLLRFGIVPPILGKDVLDGLFPLDLPKGNKCELIVRILDGIEKSNNLFKKM